MFGEIGEAGMAFFVEVKMPWFECGVGDFVIG